MLLVVELKEVVEVKRFFKIQMFMLWELLPEKVLTPYQLLGSLVRAQIGLIFKREM